MGEDRSDGIKLRYIYDAEGLSGVQYIKNQAKLYYNYIKDGLNNIAMLTYTDGTIVAQYDYDFDGNCTVHKYAGNNIGDINPFRWKGHYYDIESGFYYMNGRYYDPMIRKFVDSADAHFILENAQNLFGLDRNGLMSASIYEIAPYLATIATSVELAVDPNYDPNAGKSWWELHFIQALINAIQIAVGLIMVALGNMGGLLMILSGIAGLVSLAHSENLAKAIGLSITGAQAIAAGISLLSKCTPLGIAIGVMSLAAGAASLTFAAAEVQQGVTGNNFIRSAIGDGWYTGLMITTELLATAAVMYNQFGPKCFKEGTLVKTKEGDKKIEDIAVGDEVLSCDEDTGLTAYKKVVRLFRNKTQEWHHIFANGEEIICTAEHPFFVLNASDNRHFVSFEGANELPKQKGQWVAAKDLQISDKLLLSNGKECIIEKVEVECLSTPETTYNFEVEDYHTYYVGKQGILVHNSCSNDMADDMIQFKSRADLESHFVKHGSQLGYSSADDYLSGANYVIKSGTYVPEMNGYIRFFGAGGKANYAFVGLTQGNGNITTFGLRSVSSLTKILWLIP